LKKIGCKVLVGDSPCVWGGEIENTARVYEFSGIKRVCEEEGADLVTFDKRRWRGKFPLTTWLDDCDYVVNMPKLKTHGLTFLTGAVKNLFGLVPGTYKMEMHKEYLDADSFAKILTEIYREVKPALTIVDGITAMEGNGPGTSGQLRNTGLIFAGSDCVAIDAVLAAVMGIKPPDVLTTRHAADEGLGLADMGAIDILGEKLENIVGKPFKLAQTSKVTKLPSWVRRLIKRLIRYYPVINHKLCTRCSTCVKICPEKIMAEEEGRIIIDYSKCISCFCCQETCPDSAIDIMKNWFTKMIGL
jgi:uncharacterized protein (DUF362 family)/ferredoxin